MLNRPQLETIATLHLVTAMLVLPQVGERRIVAVPQDDRIETEDRLYDSGFGAARVQVRTQNSVGYVGS